MEFVRRHILAATAIALLLAGSAWAGSKFGPGDFKKGAITSRTIAANAVHHNEIKNHQVRSADVADDSLTPPDFQGFKTLKGTGTVAIDRPASLDDDPISKDVVLLRSPHDEIEVRGVCTYDGANSLQVARLYIGYGIDGVQITRDSVDSGSGQTTTGSGNTRLLAAVATRGFASGTGAQDASWFEASSPGGDSLSGIVHAAVPAGTAHPHRCLFSARGAG